MKQTFQRVNFSSLVLIWPCVLILFPLLSVNSSILSPCWVFTIVFMCLPSSDITTSDVTIPPWSSSQLANTTLPSIIINYFTIMNLKPINTFVISYFDFCKMFIHVSFQNKCVHCVTIRVSLDLKESLDFNFLTHGDNRTRYTGLHFSNRFTMIWSKSN